MYTVRPRTRLLASTAGTMLLNEFLKEHQEIERHKTIISQLKSTVAQQQKGLKLLTARLKEQAAQIQKVSAPDKNNRPAPQMLINPIK